MKAVPVGLCAKIGRMLILFNHEPYSPFMALHISKYNHRESHMIESEVILAKLKALRP